MRQPLPPELVVLGDHLEAATDRMLGRRRTRRQLVLNAAVSMVVAVPLGVSLFSQIGATGTVVTPPSAQAVLPPSADIENSPDDFLPRDLRRKRSDPNAELLMLPTSLRPALR